MDRNLWRALLFVTLLLAAFALKGVLIAPPRAPAIAAAGQFDTSRAFTRLQRILGDQRAHPVDTPADDAVRARLIAELSAIGLQPRVQEVEDCSGFPKSPVVSCSRVRNVIASVPGRAPGPHLLLNAHYDSTPTGPGAGDDGIGVATLLEVASILKAAPPPRPVTLLFNEGEEFGLNGAAAFVRRDPEARQVNSLINIDGRGVTGPALMYETSDPNGAALAAYQSAARRPFANSLSTDFARLIPNTTDVVFFKPRGWTLLNYGFIGNETRYHSPGDSLAALNPAMVAHLGSEVLAATRTFASLPDPAAAGTGRTVFTDIVGRMFIHLPLTVAALMLAVLLGLALALAWLRKAAGRPLLVAAMMVVGGTAGGAIAGFVLSLLRAGDFWRAYPLVAYLAVYALVVLVMTAVLARFGRLAREPLRAATWLVVLLLGSALSLAMPGAIIFFLIAPALGLLGIALSERSPQGATLLAWCAALIQLLMFAELLALIEMLLVDGPLWAVAPLAALAVLPVLIELEPTRLRPSLVMLTIAAAGLSAAALAMPRASAERPLGFTIDYFHDAARGSASWAIATKQAPLPAAMPGTWRKAVLPYNGRQRWVSQAPLIATPVATARLLASTPAGSGRRLRIAISPGGGDTVAIRFPEGAKVLALGLPGEAVPIPKNGKSTKTALRCTGRSCDGLVIEAVFGDRRPVTAELFSTRFGLPSQGAALAAARPRDAIPQYAPDSTITRSQVKL
ncbi:M20/M25/M40 family metallo-hydrolase [Sphingomonas sp.]|uniref:M20/M25/M40 family metallo-hydrolase n=1 Tax=Sphingomonas sp. TaxID=28214 RepID=UPI0038B3F606